MKLYFKYLIEQYKSARGYKELDSDKEKFKVDFYNWLSKNEQIGINYASLLYVLDIDFTTSKTAELNKGHLDSIVLPYETTIISPYSQKIDRENIFVEEVEIKGCCPQLKKYENNIHRIMLHNPYNNFSTFDFKKWRNIHEYTNTDIVLGMFGNVYDKDRDTKIKQLEIFKKHLTRECIEKYEILDDTYYYVIASKPKIKLKNID